ncbi:hypothetical protein KNP414_02993 [Paenibacillus mucilaginosus KNP414]|uniref:Uncharacterized protein n=1 Tax=Paenibacillus mucilaginosus (strain KNP414) TaxID=1036673 RepID=F8F8G3_PAEMK|nr:hypothetical protein KNP414_02993 [Paenibacillus mucilaginosus KNP414]
MDKHAKKEAVHQRVQKGGACEEAVIMDKPALKFIGLAAEVTLYDVQFNKTTLKLVAHFHSIRCKIKRSMNDGVAYGLSTDPENYRPAAPGSRVRGIRYGDLVSCPDEKAVIEGKGGVPLPKKWSENLGMKRVTYTWEAGDIGDADCQPGGYDFCTCDGSGAFHKLVQPSARLGREGRPA